MSAILTILRLVWPYLLTAGIGGFISHEIDQIPLSHVQTAFATYKAQVADANEKAQQAATDALQAQITTRLKTEANNEAVISELTQERDSAALDRDFARRLLAAAQTKSRSDPVPAAAGGQPAPDPPGASGDRSLIGDLAASAAESRQCFEQLSALQAEIAPQVNP